MQVVIAVISGTHYQYKDYVREMIEVSRKWQPESDWLSPTSFKRVRDTDDCAGALFSQVILVGTFYKCRNVADLIHACKQREKRWKAL